jgi:hypothetical protein
MANKKYNVYHTLGCSQEDHLANCGHFGYSGEYLSSHSKGCPAGDTGPCICNPTARGVSLKNVQEHVKLAEHKIDQCLQGQMSTVRLGVALSEVRKALLILEKHI